MLERNKIYEGDCRELLLKLDDNSIDCCITSPPYWSLRDYGIEPTEWDGDPECEHEWGNEQKEKLRLTTGANSQCVRPWREEASKEEISKGSYCQKCGAWLGCLGLEPNFELFIKHLADIYDIVYKKLKKTGTCWVNLGDSFGSHKSNESGLGNKHNNAVQERKPIKGYEKCLLLIPQRFAIEMVSRGWILRNVIIWHKPNCMPSSAKDRFTVDFEYVYFFVKAKKYWFEQQREPHLEQSKKRAMRGTGQHKYLKHNPHPNGIKGQSIIKEREYQGYDNMEEKIAKGETYLHPQGRNKRCVWKIPTKPNKAAHFATFPPNLVKPMILAGCPIEGVVLDPFAGTGTTCKTAFELGRDYIGFEISTEYKKIYDKFMKSTKNKRLTEFL